MATDSAPQILFSLNNDQVQGTYIVSMSNNTSIQSGDSITSATLTNTGSFGTLHYQVFARNADGSQGSSIVGPGTIAVHQAQVGPVNTSGLGLTMQTITTGRGSVLVPSVIANVSWTSS